MPQPLREFSQIAPPKSNPNGTSRKPNFTLSPYDNRTAPRSADTAQQIVSPHKPRANTNPKKSRARSFVARGFANGWRLTRKREH